MFASNLKRLAIGHPKVTLTIMMVGLLLLAGVDPVAAGGGDVSTSGGVSVGLGP